MKTKWIIIPVLALAFGCTKEIEDRTTYIDGVFSLYATSGENQTRTVLQPDGSIFWSPSDCINVFYGNLSGKFTSDNTRPAESAEFKGLLGAFTMDGQTEFIASYPYSEETTLSGNTLGISLPAEQTAAEGTFADDLFICVAKSKDYNLFFFNVCGGVKFSLSRDDVKTVVFRGNDGESLAGRLDVGFGSDGKPLVNNIHDGSPSVTLVAPDGGTFKSGVFYYLVLAPQSLSKGYTMEFYGDGLLGTESSNSPVTVRRSTWGVLKDLNPSSPESIPEAVDLGLPSGLKWASFNLGASRPEEYGDYFAWGETEPYYSSLSPLTWKEGKEAGYAWLSYKWCMGTENTMTKYCTNSRYGYSGFTDGKTILDPEDDAAHVMLGREWRMPTYEEMQDLLNNCVWEWTSLNGTNGWRVTGPNGNSIFLSANGSFADTNLTGTGYYGNYWTSTNTDFSLCSCYFGFSSSNKFCGDNCLRYGGLSIRPVYDDGPKTSIITEIPTNIGPCSAEIPFSISTTESIYGFGVIYSTDNSDPVEGNLGDGNYLMYITSEIGSSQIINGLKPNTTYYARAFITLGDERGKKVYGNTVQFTTRELSYSTEYEDLGLSVSWATCNLGSSSPSDVGAFYAWGETVPSSLRSAYKWSGANGFTKYNADDGKVTLDASDDAASVNLGGNWRMPTVEEVDELRNSCTWTPATMDGARGCTVTGPNGKSIFIPVSEGSSLSFNAELLSSSLFTAYDNYHRVHALIYYYGSSSAGSLNTFRDWGAPIRPVYVYNGPDSAGGEPEDVGYDDWL